MLVASGAVPAVVSLDGAQTTPPTTQAPPTQTLPVPKPFPGSNPNSSTPAKPAPPPAQTPDKSKPTTPPATQPAQPQTPPSQTPAPVVTNAPMPAGAPTEATLGVKLFPGVEYLESFDAGRGQRLYLFGTNAPFADVAAFYKAQLHSGTELFKEPAMLQFDLPGSKFQKELMAFPPSVVVKDYTWRGVTGELKEGYVFVTGTTEKRFNTVVQIVPAPPAAPAK
jgi:hypothetical protein